MRWLFCDWIFGYWDRFRITPFQREALGGGGPIQLQRVCRPLFPAGVWLWASAANRGRYNADASGDSDGNEQRLRGATAPARPDCDSAATPAKVVGILSSSDRIRNQMALKPRSTASLRRNDAAPEPIKPAPPQPHRLNSLRLCGVLLPTRLNPGATDDRLAMNRNINWFVRS